MSDGTTLLFALPGYRVLDVSAEPDGGRRVLVEALAAEAACPECGVFTGRVHERPVRRVKDLPYGALPLRVWVRKRRYRCPELACPRRSFTETTPELPARARLTGRLRVKVTSAVTGTNRAIWRCRRRARDRLAHRATRLGRRRGRPARAGGADHPDRNR